LIGTLNINLKKVVMKKLILLFAAVIISFVNATPQPCLPNGITFSTQEMIDTFQANYPGCTEIEGNVTIQGAGITNLNGLNVMMSIGGKLEIRSNSSLTSLAGLEGLSSVGGNLFLFNNPLITSLTGLNNLTTIGGYLWIKTNESLTTLAGLESLTSIDNAIWLCKFFNIFLIFNSEIN